jgi:hypothetical protein
LPVWDQDGNFYCADLNQGVVRKYDGHTAALLGTFADPPENGNAALAFGGDGQLYISGVWNSTIYRADGTNGAILGTLTTNVDAGALLAVPPPRIGTQPQNQTARAKGNATFTLAVQSVAVASYQWNINGIPIPGATNANLRLAEVSTNQAGGYSVTASNIGGAVTSAMAALTVLQSAELRLTSGSGSGMFELSLTGDERGIYAIESSTNLIDWVWVETWWAKNSPLVVWNQPWWESNPVRQRFYRARLFP